MISATNTPVESELPTIDIPILHPKLAIRMFRILCSNPDDPAIAAWTALVEGKQSASDLTFLVLREMDRGQRSQMDSIETKHKALNEHNRQSFREQIKAAAQPGIEGQKDAQIMRDPHRLLNMAREIHRVEQERQQVLSDFQHQAVVTRQHSKQLIEIGLQVVDQSVKRHRERKEARSRRDLCDPLG